MKALNTIQWTKLWILLSVYLNIAGWVLSALGCLDPLGYSVVVGVAGLLGLGLIFKRSGDPIHWGAQGKWRWRMRRFLPALFMVLFVLAFIGGALYPPNNYDALTYRFPRLLHWFSEHQWHWIPRPAFRMNYSSTGFEWLMAPLFALTKSDRGFFLINILSYALLPGLTYAAFIRLGIARRVAWYWMWLLPCGICFATQAGSICNDAFAAIYLLASIYFALQARVSRKISDLWLSVLAAALLTAAKGSNLPLLLPWMLAVWPSLGLLKKHILATAAIACLALGASFFPIAVANTHYAGKWTGVPENSKTSQILVKKPFYGIYGNTLQLLNRNVMPPVMPVARLWNQKTDLFLQSPAGQRLLQNFPRLNLSWGELDIEEGAGLGLGLSALLVLSLIASLARRATPKTPRFHLGRGAMICASTWIALLALMAQVGSMTLARIITPFYPLIIASVLLLPGMSALTRRRWWKVCAVIAALAALPILILTPSRPLWPALTFFKKTTALFPENPLLAHALTVYSVYRNRADSLAPLREFLSADDQVVGFVGVDDSEVALWRPFEGRKVIEVVPSNIAQFAHDQRLIFTREEGIQTVFHQSEGEWIKATGAEIVGKKRLLQKVSRGERDWVAVRIKTAPPQLTDTQCGKQGH